MANNVNSPFSGQEYQVGYIQFDDNLNTEVESFDMDLVDGGADIKTLARGYAGRVKGAAMCTFNFSGALPYAPTDTGGVGMSSGGMVTGKGVQLDQTMLTNYNQNQNLPVKFTVDLGNPAVQTLVFKGNITNMKFSAAVGQEVKFSGTATGTFSTWSS